MQLELSADQGVATEYVRHSTAIVFLLAEAAAIAGVLFMAISMR